MKIVFFFQFFFLRFEKLARIFFASICNLQVSIEEKKRQQLQRRNRTTVSTTPKTGGKSNFFPVFKVIGGKICNEKKENKCLRKRASESEFSWQTNATHTYKRLCHFCSLSLHLSLSRDVFIFAFLFWRKNTEFFTKTCKRKIRKKCRWEIFMRRAIMTFTDAVSTHQTTFMIHICMHIETLSYRRVSTLGAIKSSGKWRKCRFSWKQSSFAYLLGRIFLVNWLRF